MNSDISENIRFSYFHIIDLEVCIWSYMLNKDILSACLFVGAFRLSDDNGQKTAKDKKQKSVIKYSTYY